MRGESIVAIYYWEWSGEREKGTKCNTVHGVVGYGCAFSLFFHLVRNQLFGGELGSSLALVVFCRGIRPCCHECFHSTQLVLFGGLMQWGVTFVVLTVDLRLTLDEEVDAFIMAPT